MAHRDNLPRKALAELPLEALKGRETLEDGPEMIWTLMLYEFENSSIIPGGVGVHSGSVYMEHNS